MVRSSFLVFFVVFLCVLCEPVLNFCSVCSVRSVVNCSYTLFVSIRGCMFFLLALQTNIFLFFFSAFSVFSGELFLLFIRVNSWLYVLSLSVADQYIFVLAQCALCVQW